MTTRGICRGMRVGATVLSITLVLSVGSRADAVRPGAVAGPVAQPRGPDVSLEPVSEAERRQLRKRVNLARLLVGGAGLVSVAGGAVMLLTLPRLGEPGGWLTGAGAIAFGGATVGALLSLVTFEHHGLHRDYRAGPSALSLSYTLAAPVHVGERPPHGLALRWAPQFMLLGDRSRLQIFGQLGGDLGPRQSVDPAAHAGGLRDQAYPASQSRTSMNLNVGADWAFEMPRARRLAEGRAALGRVFLRWRPAYEFRREARIPEGLATRAVERHMLLPLNIGFRWQISARHRFSATLGPRIDLTGYALKVGDDWQRHPAKRAQWGQFHGDAWYEVDFPLSRADIDTPSRWRAAGRLRLGYIHSTFDGQAFNSGAIIGYTGPFYAGWSTRIAKPSVNGRLRAALQIDIGAFIADVPRFHLDVGVALPRPRLRPSPRSRGSRR